MDSKANKEGGDCDNDLFGQTKKGKGKGPSKSKVKSEESTSQSRKKYVSKAKFFICHKNDHYAS